MARLRQVDHNAGEPSKSEGSKEGTSLPEVIRSAEGPNKKTKVSKKEKSQEIQSHKARKGKEPVLAEGAPKKEEKKSCDSLKVAGKDAEFKKNAEEEEKKKGKKSGDRLNVVHGKGVADDGAVKSEKKKRDERLKKDGARKELGDLTKKKREKKMASKEEIKLQKAGKGKEPDEGELKKNEEKRSPAAQGNRNRSRGTGRVNNPNRCAVCKYRGRGCSMECVFRPFLSPREPEFDANCEMLFQYVTPAKVEILVKKLTEKDDRKLLFFSLAQMCRDFKRNPVYGPYSD